MQQNDIVVAACVQMVSNGDMQENITKARAFIKDAAEQGAELIALPEHVALRVERDSEWAEKSDFTQADHPAVQAFQETAQEHGVWLLVGSVAVREKGAERFANRSLLINADGEVAATYDKITLFDIDLTAQGGGVYKESDTFQPGKEAVVADTPWGGLGMTICADVRTPEIYRELAMNGAEIIAVPAAFTQQTGAAGNWHDVLKGLRLDTQAYIMAPGMARNPSGGRKSAYGHSIILDGRYMEEAIMAELGDAEEGVIVAKLDMAALRASRTQNNWLAPKEFTVRRSGSSITPTPSHVDAVQRDDSGKRPEGGKML